MGRGRMLSNDDGSLLQICINFIRKDCDTIAPAISEPPMVHVCPQPSSSATLHCTPFLRPMGDLSGQELDLSAWWHQGIDSKDRNGVFSRLLSGIGTDSKNLVSTSQLMCNQYNSAARISFSDSNRKFTWTEARCGSRGCLLLVGGGLAGDNLLMDNLNLCFRPFFQSSPHCTEAPCNYHFGARTTTAFPRALTPSMLSEQLSVADNANGNRNPLFHSTHPGSQQIWRPVCKISNYSVLLLAPIRKQSSSNGRHKDQYVMEKMHQV